MKKITQVGLAVALYTENKDISHEEFVERMCAEFPALPRKTAALYWQNKDRRASFGLAPARLPDVYKDKSGSAEKSPKEKSAERMVAETIAVAAPKVSKPKKAQPETKTPEEIERIKAANLKRLKEVHAKVKQNVKRDEEVLEADPFAAPAALTVDEVTALV